MPEDVQQLVAFEPWRGRWIGGIGKADQGVARVLGSRGCVDLKGLAPLFGENRPHCACIGVYMLRPASEGDRSLGTNGRRLSMHGYASSRWVGQILDRKSGARGNAIGTHLMCVDAPLQGLVIGNPVSGIREGCSHRNLARNYAARQCARKALTT